VWERGTRSHNRGGVVGPGSVSTSTMQKFQNESNGFDLNLTKRSWSRTPQAGRRPTGFARPGPPRRFRGMHDLHGLVVCRWCIRSGPVGDLAIAGYRQLEFIAVSAGWRQEDGTWLCRECIARQLKAAQN
jgi:hypothetical protein